VPYIHNAFENVAATMSGVEAAYRALKKKGKITQDMRFIAFGGDGGTYDIGLQSLSGMLERGQRVLYVCYDNEAYMNTAFSVPAPRPWARDDHRPRRQAEQRQDPEPQGSDRYRHRAPAGLRRAGFAPQSCRVHEYGSEGACADGPSFINALSTCHRGWRIPQEKSIEILKLAADTCFWPIYEWQDGKYTITYKPKEKKPVEEWLKTQGRFKHLFAPQNRHVIDALQAEVDRSGTSC